MSYFECNLPEMCPAYIHPSKQVEFSRTLARVKARMKKLDDALELSGMDEAVFAKTAKVLFDNFLPRFDSCGAETLAIWVQDSTDGEPVAHRLEWPNAVTVVDCAFLTREEWELIRHLGLGGSDAAAVLGQSVYKNAQETYHDKVYTPKKMDLSRSPQGIYDRGHYLEDKVVDAFLNLTGFKRIPETRMFRSKTYPHAMADIDAIIQSQDGRLFVFEAKTTVAENYKAWARNNIPVSYIPQTRQYPAVLNDDRICGTYIGCIFTVDLLVGGLYVGSSFSYEQFVARSVDRSPHSEKYQLEMLELWWQQYVETNKEPPASHIAKDDIMVYREFHSGPGDIEKTVLDLTNELPKLQSYLDAYFKLMEKKSAQQKTADALDNDLKNIQLAFMERMKDSVEARINLPGGEEYVEIKWSPRGRTETDLERLAVAFPDAYEACVTRNDESSRVFTLKKKKVKRGKSK